MKTNQHRARGFTLIEALVAVALLAAFVATTTHFALQQRQEARLESLVQTQASEMVALHNAGLQWASEQSRADFAANFPIDLPGWFIQAADIVPDSFADRGNVPGAPRFAQVMRSPFGQEYVVNVTYTVPAAVEHADGHWSVVVSEVGEPSEARLARAGLSLTDTDLLGLKLKLANVLATEHKVYVGVMAPGTRLATAPNQSWKKDLTGNLSRPVQSTSTLAVISGIEGIDVEADICQINPTAPGCSAIAGTSGGYSNCEFVPSTYNTIREGTYTDAQCPAGWDEVWRQPAANEQEVDSLDLVPVVGVSMRKSRQYELKRTIARGYHYCSSPGVCTLLFNSKDQVQVTMGGQFVWSGVVRQHFWTACNNSFPHMQCDGQNNPVRLTKLPVSAGTNALCCDSATRL